MSDVWSWPGWAALGVLFGALATIAAFLAWRQGKRSQQIADARYKIADDRYARVIVPRPRLVGLRPVYRRVSGSLRSSTPEDSPVTACSWFKKESQLLAGGTALPSHGTTHMRLTFRQEIQGGAILQPNLLIIAAKDVQGDWWDCVQGVRIEDLQTWWADQLNSLDLPIIGLEESPDGLTVRALGGH